MSIGAGQSIRLRMWNETVPEDDEAYVVADGVLDPGADINFTFTEPQTVTRVAVERITRAEAEQLEAETGVKQTLMGRPSA